MSDALLAVFAVVVSFVLFVVGGWFYFRNPEPDRPADPPEYKVEQTFTAKPAPKNTVIAWIRQSLGPGRSGTPGHDSGEAPRKDDHQPSGQGDDPPPRGRIVVEQVRPHDPPPPPPAAPALPAPDPPAPQVEVVVDRPRPPEFDGELKPAPVVEGPRPAGWPNLIELQGVDMSQAPIVPASDGTTMPLPSVSQLQEALATGGFERFMTWLRAFFRASGILEADARNVHEDAMNVAARARNKYVLALQAFQAVQADGLDQRTITRMWEALAQAEQEANAAALATHATAQTVIACGGGQPTVAAVIRALDYGHGDIARAVQSAPVRVVRKFSFYQN